MSPAALVLAAFLLDLLVGDPRWLPHPVVGIGRLIRALEGGLERLPWRRAAGVLLTLLTVAITAFLAWGSIALATALHPWCGTALAVWLACSCLATRSLHTESVPVVAHLRAGHLVEARQALAMLVSRDTASLDEAGILRGTVETVSENSSDGIVAPLFYLCLGGPVLALAYKAASTLDSMVGYRNERYLDFGWASARLDDLLNLIPARLTALFMALAAPLAGGSIRHAWHIAVRDAGKSKSPNAGWPMAAAAGALGVQLGGPAVYFGRIETKPILRRGAAPADTGGLRRHDSPHVCYRHRRPSRRTCRVDRMAVTPVTHGGNVLRLARERGVAASHILDFSASINPLGMPDEVRAAAVAALADASHYPEIDAAPLCTALATFHDLPPGHFLPGNGSTPLFFLFARTLRPRRALLVEPAFGEYRRALELAGTTIDRFPLDPATAFALDPAALLAALHPATDLVLIANPGNPSGTGYAPQLLLDLATALRDRALLAVDEAFVDFCPEHSLIARIAAGDNLYIFRSLTKFYAIAGLRAGYLAGPAEGIARLAAAAEPWSLSTPALAASLACLAADDFRARTLAAVPVLRQDLAAGLAALGFTVCPSVANYLLAHCPAGTTALPLAARLAEEGILIRTCDDFYGLDESYLRVAVRTAEENRRLLVVLERAV